MAAPTDPRNLDHAIELYLARKSGKEIESATGVGGTVLARERRRRGIPARGRRVSIDSEAIVAAYLGGESEYALSQRLGVSRELVRRRLIEAEVEIRRPSEAGLLRASKMPASARRLQAEAAHAARRGRKDSLEHLEIRARTRERDGKYGSEGELLLARLLEERGFAPVPQKAVSKYNVDVAATDTIAVEVLGGNWHAAKRIHHTRTPDILNAGWHLVFVWNQQGTGPITAGAADYLVAFEDEVRWHPSAPRQYRVISGDGQVLAAGSSESKEFALVPPPRGAKRTGA